MASGDQGLVRYRNMKGHELSKALEMISNATSYDRPFSAPVDAVDFQPCKTPGARSQDRHVVEQWTLPGGVWTFVAVFDGHIGHETVDYTAQNLPSALKNGLTSALLSGQHASPDLICELLIKTIINFDNSLASDLCDLFSDGVQNLSDDEIGSVLRETSNGESNLLKLLRCFKGTTAVISLVDPAKEVLWVANLGDSQAVLATRRTNENQWDLTMLAIDQNVATNSKELQRIQSEHPNEDLMFEADRVLGLISPTRTIGDWFLKFPASFVARMLPHISMDFSLPDALNKLLERNRTPPYLSSRPEISHVELSSDQGSEQFLIMASDGLLNVYNYEPTEKVMALWAASIGRAAERYEENAAVRILRDGLGGEDTKRVSRRLTSELEQPWLDDTTIIVVPL